MSRVKKALRLAILVSAVLAPSAARANSTHIVQRGHTIESIAHRYGVTAKAIVLANHLTDPEHLKPGQVLVIPAQRERAVINKVAGTSERSEGAGANKAAGRANTTVRVMRLGEELEVRVRDARGHVPASALKAFEHIMRQGNSMHPVDPRLIALVGAVSDHFEGKPIEVVSGYRAYRSTQYTPHSNHNDGKAVDFRVVGVRNEDVRDFCRSLPSAGCGYYPNSSFVHIDVRTSKAFWVDTSLPGEPPKYEKPEGAADDTADSEGPEQASMESNARETFPTK